MTPRSVWTTGKASSRPSSRHSRHSSQKTVFRRMGFVGSSQEKPASVAAKTVDAPGPPSHAASRASTESELFLPKTYSSYSPSSTQSSSRRPASTSMSTTDT